MPVVNERLIWLQEKHKILTNAQREFKRENH